MSDLIPSNRSDSSFGSSVWAPGAGESARQADSTPSLMPVRAASRLTVEAAIPLATSATRAAGGHKYLKLQSGS